MILLKKLRIIAKFTLIIMMLVIIASPVSHILYADNSTTGSISEEKKKKEEMEKELKDTKNFLNNLKNKASNTSDYIEKLDTRLNKLSDNIYDLENQAAEKQKEIDGAKVEVEKAEKNIVEQYEAMKLRIQYMYENSNMAVMQMFLESKDISDFLNRAEYINKITEYDREMLEQLREQKNNIVAMKENLEKQLAELNDTLNEAEEEKKAVEELSAAKAKELKGYNSEMSEASEEIASLKEEIAIQEALIKELEEIERKRREEAIKNNLKLTYDGGQLAWPLPGYSRISSGFGERKDPFTGKVTEAHYGIDIPAPQGTKIYACYDGEVAWAKWNNSAGNWVGIDHGDGLYTVYMHMSKILVKPGQKISKGDVVGLVGSTGRSTGPHLHLAVRLNGKYVQPLDYVNSSITK